jgi:hypothetical protein
MLIIDTRRKIKAIDETRAIAQLLGRTQMATQTTRRDDAIRQQMQNEHIGHVGVARVNFSFLFAHANVTHILGVAIEIGLVGQTL